MAKVEKEVIKANESFYRAFESLKLTNMESVWSKDAIIECIHPGWRPLRGWEPVMASWKRIFENTTEIHFMLTDVSVRVSGALAWVTLYENITSPVEGETVSGTVVTTNIFRREAEGWRIIHHHGSPVSQHPAQFNPSTVH